MEEKNFELMENQLYENYMGFFGTDEYDVEENIVIDDEKSFNQYEIKLNLEFDDWFSDEVVEISPEFEKIKEIDKIIKKKLNSEKTCFPKFNVEVKEIKRRMEKINEKFYADLLKSKRKIKKLKQRSVIFNDKVEIKNFLKNENIKKQIN